VPDDVAILLLDNNLQPVSGAVVDMPEWDRDGTTNYNGLFIETNRLRGKHTYELTGDGNSVEATVNVYSDDTEIENLFDLEGPDEVLIQVAGLGFGLIIPVMAIGISFDSISGEKISRSIIFLLCRPISKRAIAVGKFLGSSIAISIPLVLVSLISVAIISSITNESPSGGFVAGFIVVTIIFMTIFVLLQQIFSTLAKTTGTAILSGIGVWLFYFMFFGLIILLISVLMGIQFMSYEYFRLANQLSLLSPSGIYSFLINQIAPSGASSFTGIPDWAPAVSFIIWFVVLFIITMELFRRKPYL
jgi:ABC-type transport system involved in multi-copper enzyme maturation permease subunit